MIHKKICFAGGKSAGHIVPLLTLAQSKKNTDPKTTIFFIADTTALDKKLIASADLVTKSIFITCHAKTGSLFFYYLQLLVLYSAAFLKAFFFLYKNRPGELITSGGSLSIPVCYAAWILKIPIHLYELNVVPGKAAHCVSKIADTVHVCFKKTISYFPKNKTHLSAYPLQAHQQKTTAENDYKQKPITLLIAGGSQGSAFLNELIQRIFENYPNLIEHSTVIHQTGTESTKIQAWYKKNNITATVFEYAANFRDFYDQADFIIARAGSGTLHEILFSKKFACIIPLETATTNHRVDNALSMQAEHPEQFVVIRQKLITHDVTLLYDLIDSRIKKNAVQEKTKQAMPQV